MADQRAVDGALAQGVSAIESTYNDLQGHFRRLEGDLSTIGSSWQGSASVQFTQLMPQWQDNAAKVNQALRPVRDADRRLKMDCQVYYGALDGAAADIKSGAANLQGCLDDLENTLNQLRSSWEGQAQEAYNAAQVKWNQGLEGLKDVLSRTSAAVDSARSNYQQTDQASAARF